MREERKKDPKFKMKPTKGAPGSAAAQGHEDGDIFPGTHLHTYPYSGGHSYRHI